MGSSPDDHNYRFMQPLLPGFLNTFSIPESFLKHLKLDLKGHHLQSVVLMTDDQPQRHWTVQVEGDRHFKDGWEEFSTHHDLHVGDFLVFTYQSHLLFQVCVFDPVTACKRISRISDHLKPILKTQGGKRIKVEFDSTHTEVAELKETEADRATAGPSEQGQYPSCHVKLTSYNVGKSIVFLPARFVRGNGMENRACDVRLIDEKERSWQVRLNYKKCDGQSYIKRGWKDVLAANYLRSGNVVCFQLLDDGKLPVLKCSSSKSIGGDLNSHCKVKPKEAQAKSATEIASGQDQSRFRSSRVNVTTAIPCGHGQNQYPSCHVHLTTPSLKRSTIYFPVHFVRASGLEHRSCEMRVVDEKDRPWKLRLNYRKCDGISYINGGVKGFVAANSLKPRDVVCFQLMKAGRCPMLKCYRIS